MIFHVCILRWLPSKDGEKVSGYFQSPFFEDLFLFSIHKAQGISLAGAEVYHAQVAAHQRAAVPQPRM